MAEKECNRLEDGTGVAGNFLGLETCRDIPPKVAILPVAFEHSTSYQTGTAGGPEAIIEASRNIEGFDVELKLEPYRIGIETLPVQRPGSSADMLESVSALTAEQTAAGRFVITLGGEHSISLAAIQGVTEREEEISVLQFDAHTDLREAYEGDRYSHASVMARVKELPQVSNVVAVGIRAMDKSEYDSCVKENIFFDHQLQENNNSVEEIISRLGERVYISFDVDVFNSALMPSTGTPEPGGIDWFTAIALLKAVAKQRTVIGFDLMELMPIDGLLAPNFLAAKLVYKYIGYQFSDDLQVTSQ